MSPIRGLPRRSLPWDRTNTQQQQNGVNHMNREHIWDTDLCIHTAGRDEAKADAYRYPYEPTPYGVLEQLADRGLMGEGDVVLDYGCGKGRVGFFLSHMTGVGAVGIEYDGRMYEAALENQRTVISGTKIRFVLARAEQYEVPPEVNRCYFFNPFSVEILHKVLARIMESYYENPREMLLLFYYPSDHYCSCLLGTQELELYDEIACGDLFPGNDPRERILVFRLRDYGENSGCDRFREWATSKTREGKLG